MNTSKVPFSPSLAFLIGAANYKHVPSLETPGQDVKALSKVLEDHYGFQVFPCHNPDKSILKELFEQEIPHQLNLLGKQAESASVIVFFAGHGIAQDSRSGPQGYLAPIDAQNGVLDSMYDMRSMVLSLDKLPCKHLLLILDCCFGGTARWSSKHRGISIAPDYFSQQHFHHFMQRRSWQVLTSTAPDQPALDFLGHGEEEGHSPFAHYLIKGLKGEADTIQDKVITASELYQYLQNRVTQVTAQNVGFFPLDNHDHGEFLFVMQDFSPENLPVSAAENPYMGLDSYDEQRSSLFFGRKKATEEVVKRVEEYPLTVVTGASGSGKSSLVKAGVAPKLKGEKKIITPGRFPLSELEAAKNADILIIDQFEQLITQAEEKDAKKFINELPDLIRSGKKVVVTVRIDFEAQLELPEELKRLWDQNRYLVPPFSAEELREVILTPALRAGRFFEPMDLVDTMVTEVVGFPGSMPLLSFTLRQLFQKSLDSNDPYRTISEKDYHEVGGVHGALQKGADEALREMPDEAHRQTMRNLMLRMVSLSGGEIAGRRVMDDELIFDTDETTRMETVRNLLLSKRLIQSGRDREGTVFWEPCHDALIRSWKTMENWIREFKRENLMLQSKLDEAIGEYHRKNKQSKFLWHKDPGLEQVIAAQKDPVVSLKLSKEEEQFVKKSISLRKRNTRNSIISGIGITVIITSLAISFSYSNRIAIEKAFESGLAGATALKNEGKYAEALQELESTKKDAPKYSPKLDSIRQKWEVFFNLADTGDSLREMGKLKEAVEKYQECHNIEPSDQRINDKIVQTKTELEETFNKLMERGKGHLRYENFTYAVEVFEAALKLKDDPEAKKLLSDCYANSQNN